MKASSKFLLALGVFLVLALVAFVIFSRPTASDQDQILAQMELARSAAVHHDANGILTIVSADYKDSHGFNNDQLALALRRGLHSSEAIQVQMTQPSVIMQGERATTISHLQVITQEDHASRFEDNLTLHWKREDGHRLLVIPTKVWRVVGADYQQEIPGAE